MSSGFAPASRAPHAWLLRALTLAILLPGAAAPVAAQRVKPWVPPQADSLVHWVAEARVLFQANTGDSIGGANYRPYELVGNVGRRLLRSIGRDNMIQARAVEALLDSMGLDTDLIVDTELPYFALLMVRNPFRIATRSVGFLYWWRAEDLRMQGAQFSGAHRPRARVWWTGNQDRPYAWGVVDESKGADALHFTLFRLTPRGEYWVIGQYEDSGYKLGPQGTVSWSDVNGDLQPELIAWVPGTEDSLFESCSGCPKLVTEVVFGERPEGFKMQDTRIVPSPFSTFTLFVRMLVEGNRAQAARLLKDPKQVDRAIAEGWATRKNRIWSVEQAEPQTSWPEWIRMRFRGPRGDRSYVVYFEQLRGRWVIRDWASRENSGAPAPAATPPRGGKP